MNDKELDYLLNCWEAPAPPHRLRDRLRERFPLSERRPRFAHPLRWVLVAAALSAAGAVGMQQTGATPWDFRIGDAVTGFYHHVVQLVEAHQTWYIVTQVRKSGPRVFIDGQLGQPVEFTGARMDVNVPGEGVFSVILVPGVPGFSESGAIHDNVVEFRAGGKQVRIECNSPIVRSEQKVYSRLRK